MSVTLIIAQLKVFQIEKSRILLIIDIMFESIEDYS